MDLLKAFFMAVAMIAGIFTIFIMLVVFYPLILFAGITFLSWRWISKRGVPLWTS